MNVNAAYEYNKNNELCELMAKYGSDKGSLSHNGRHNYTAFYYEMFKDVRNEALNIFELGLGTNNIDVFSNMGPDGKPGASLRAWREFFPNAQIYGGDIDVRILFQEERIKTYYCDQRTPDTIKDMWTNPDLNDLTFDIIIDDGLNDFMGNKFFFENYR